jgi:HK97 family phage major capsid protein
MTDLSAERTTTLDHAKSILATCKAAGREPTNAEQDALTASVARVKELDRQLAGRALVNSVRALGTSEDVPRDGAPVASIFTEDAKAGIISAVKSRTSYRTALDLGGMKAALTSGTLLPTSGIGVEGGLQPTGLFSLTSLFANEQADGPTVRYYRTTAGTAAVVPEGTLKPDAGVTFAAVDLALRKLACLAQFSDEMQDDASFLIGYLQQELLAAVVAAENKLIVDTFAATSGVLTATGAASTIVDMVADAIAAEEAVSGLTPAAIVAAPSVIATIRKSKASTSGVYNTDILSTSPTMLHGVRLVSSPAVPAANVWVVSTPASSSTAVVASPPRLGTTEPTGRPTPRP